jgi:acetyl/propionyl-CoA carboxylase alpha subunit
MRRALDEYQVRGIETNLAFHRRCFRQQQFIEGDYDTGFIGRNAQELHPRADDAELAAAIIAAALDGGAGPAAQPQTNGVTHTAPSTEISGWRRALH